MKGNTKKNTIIGILSALAYAVVVVGRVPLVLFLKYDPKDIVIAIGGLIFGPLTSFSVSLIVSLVEMVTISENGVLGCIMNVISSCSFACTAAFIYKHRHTLSGAIIGLLRAYPKIIRTPLVPYIFRHTASIFLAGRQPACEKSPCLTKNLRHNRGTANFGISS